jgi:hypothetical protein
MNVLVYGVTNWDDKSHADSESKVLHEWYDRTSSFVNYNDIFLSTGTYSDPEFNPLDIPVIQNNLPKTEEYGRGWNYFRNGFVTGIWSALFRDDWDILLHNQCRILLGEDMNKHLEAFMDSPELIMAPKFSNVACLAVEIGFLAMKREAALRVVTQSRRPSLYHDDHAVVNCEDEIYQLFSDSWYDPFDIRTTRKRDWNWPEESPYHLEMEEFLSLPLISASHHATSEEIDEWINKHPII